MRHLAVAVVLALPALAAAAEPGHVNSAVCARCHAQIARTYALTGMGRSIYRPSPENLVEDFTRRNTLLHQPSGRRYTMTFRVGQIFQRRDDDENHTVEMAADYIIGSGNHVRSYLHRTTEGRFVELPVSWYAGNFWGISPGYDTPDHMDFRRAINYDCVFCHAAYPTPGPGVTFGADDSLFGAADLEAIDCQRCHGPGRAHVEAGGGTGNIVNPARLSRERRMDLCMECHLETTASYPITSIRRYQREPFSYRPGEPLADFALYFDQAPSPRRDQKFEFAHAAYGLRKSACFRGSRMTCTTCHNPHDIPRGAAAAERYVAACRTCHTTGHAAAQTACLDCHMPKRTPDDVVHTAVTDHYIQRHRPPGDLVTARPEKHEAYDGEIIPYYPTEATPENQLYRAVAQVRYSANPAGIQALQQLIERRHPSRPEFYFELGAAYWKAGRKPDAIRWYGEALQHGDYYPARRALGETLLATGQLDQAATQLERAAAESPRDPETLYDLAGLRFRQNRLDAALQAVDAALAIRPDYPLARNLLGTVLGHRGDKPGATAAFRESIRVQPDLDTARINLALVLAGDGDYARAAAQLEKAIAAHPLSADAHHTYGLVLERTGARRQSIAEFETALRLDPAMDTAHLDLGRVLAAEGRSAEARPHFQKAAQSSDPAVRRDAQAALAR